MTRRRSRPFPANLGDCSTPAERLADAHRALANPMPRHAVPAHLRASAATLRDAVLHQADFARAGSAHRRTLLAIAGRLYQAMNGDLPVAQIPGLLDESRRAIGTLV